MGDSVCNEIFLFSSFTIRFVGKFKVTRIDEHKMRVNLVLKLNIFVSLKIQKILLGFFVLRLVRAAVNLEEKFFMTGTLIVKVYWKAKTFFSICFLIYSKFIFKIF